MSLGSHITELRKKHQALSEQVERAARSPGIDDLAIAERLRRSLRRKPMDTGEQEIQVTASFGVAEYDPEGVEDAPAFVALADQALYQAIALVRCK